MEVFFLLSLSKLSTYSESHGVLRREIGLALGAARGLAGLQRRGQDPHAARTPSYPRFYRGAYLGAYSRLPLARSSLIESASLWNRYPTWRRVTEVARGFKTSGNVHFKRGQ